MTTLFEALSFVADGPATDESLQAALDCLDRYTDRFNACDAAGMDAHLHFPHTMLSGSQPFHWTGPGQLSADFFDALKASGWHHTCYESRQAVLIGPDKVHFVVSYSRRDAEDRVLSTHLNLWIVTRAQNRWGIVLRSY